MAEIEINSRFLEKCANSSLEGFLHKEFGEVFPSELTLVFVQSSNSYRRHNGGPDLYLLPEYSILCFTKSIIGLIDRGVKISINEKIDETT